MPIVGGNSVKFPVLVSKSDVFSSLAPNMAKNLWSPRGVYASRVASPAPQLRAANEIPADWHFRHVGT